MKKYFYLICYFLITLPTLAQDPVSKIKSEIRGVLKPNEAARYQAPLLVLILNGDTLNTKHASNVSNVDLKWVDDFDIYKGEYAISLFGNRAKNGVIALTLFDSEPIREYFRTERQRIEDNDDSEVLLSLEDGDTFTFDELVKEDKAQSSRTNREMNIFLTNHPIYIMSLNGDEAFINSEGDVKHIRSDRLKLVHISGESEKAKTKYQSNGENVFIMVFKETTETRKFFDSLKKVNNN